MILLSKTITCDRFKFPNFSAPDTIIVAASRTLKIRVSVSNSNGSDPAYNARVEITLNYPVFKSPLSCKKLEVEETANVTDTTKLLCDAGNPLNSNTIVSRVVLFTVQCNYSNDYTLYLLQMYDSYSQKELDIEVDIDDTRGVKSSLNVTLKALTSSENIGETNETATQIRLRARADITVSG
jgi:hypothetical protein